MKGIRTFRMEVLSPALVCMWVLVGLSRACTPVIPESTELKAYRAGIIVEGMTRLQGQDILAIVTKTLKGDIGEQDEIIVTGFGTEQPCFWDNTELDEGTQYLLYLEEDMESTINVTGQGRAYIVVGNPDVSNGAVKRKIRKAVNQGGPPVFIKQLKDRRVLAGDKVNIKCQADGFPAPSFTFRKDGEVLQNKGGIKGISVKLITSGIRLRVKKADKLLHEGLYECIATNGVDAPIVTSLTLSICAQTCVHGELKEKKCLCACDEGWRGPSCDIQILTTPIPTFVPKCDLDCGDNGVLNEQLCTCTCEDGYTGPQCTATDACNITCAHGTRDNDTCSCNCQSGYHGNDCSVTAESLCLAGTFCQNGGTCYQCLGDKTCYPVNETTHDNPELTVFCRCSENYMGDRCEFRQCQDLKCDHGTLDVNSCSCICNVGYRGDRCHVAKDNHTKPCSDAWNGYCLNGGDCYHLLKLNKPSCRCPSQYNGDRCQLFDPEVSCYEGFCLNGGVCSFEANQDPCICDNNYGGDRCQFLRPGQIIRDGVVVQTHYAHARYLLTVTEMEIFTETFGTKPDSKKLIVTMTAIFVFMMLVIAIVVFVYIKNRSVRERERRERISQMMKEHSANAYGGGGTEAADDIQMRTFHNAQPESTSIHMENDTHLHLNPNPLSRPIRTNGMTTPPPCYPGFIALNGNSHVSSKASIHSNNNSAGSANSNHSSPGSEQQPPQGRVRDGYEEIPGDDPSEVEMSTTATPVHTPGKGDPDTLPTQASQEESSTTEDSDESSGSDIEGDTVDIPNPQIMAIENHIATSDRENSSGDYTWDEYNHNLRFANPYAMDSSPVHKPVKPRSRLNGNSTSQQVNILENPILNGGANSTEQSTNLSSSPKDNIYNDRLKDVVENSPPSAV